jgi:ABC-2 type transport system permease protein
MTDALVVARKELREILGGGSRKGLLRELILVFLFGVFFPIAQAEAWMAGIAPTAFFVVIPLFIAGPHVADTFAGEKERNTLETLLATRLPDHSIYLGKILAVCLYAWALAWLMLAASLAALSLVAGNGIFLYPAPVWLAVAVGALASSLLIAGIGTFISLRSETVRGAHQALMLPLLIVIFGLSLGLPALYGVLPDAVKAQLVAWAEGVSALEALAWIFAFLLAVDAILLWLGVRRFRRGRLIAG